MRTVSHEVAENSHSECGALSWLAITKSDLDQVLGSDVTGTARSRRVPGKQVDGVKSALDGALTLSAGRGAYSIRTEAGVVRLARASRRHGTARSAKPQEWGHRMTRPRRKGLRV
jgi:hypothetical protein